MAWFIRVLQGYGSRVPFQERVSVELDDRRMQGSWMSAPGRILTSSQGTDSINRNSSVDFDPVLSNR